MKYSDTEQLKQRLEMQLQEVLQSLSRVEYERKSLDAEPAKDSADQCVTSLSTDSLFERSSQRRTMLRLVEAALRRIAEGSFGVCVACGDVIQDRRLEALPWTQFCLRCQELIEQEVGENVSARYSIDDDIRKRTG
jgi:DnaK suppressor protein